MRRTLLALGVLAALGSRAHAAPVVVATASKTEVSVGEPFVVEVQASGPAGCTFAFPGELKLEAIELGPEPPPAQGTAPAPPTPTSHRYRAEVFAVGEVQVPPIPVRYRLADGSSGEVSTAAVPLSVVSLLPKAKDEQRLADVRPPLRLAVSRLFWIALGVLGLLVAALVVWLVRRRRTDIPVAAPVTPALEPDEEARRALDGLAASGRLARGELRPFYIELTAIAKRYLERRLDAPIAEMTSAEMLAHLRETPYGNELAPLLRDLSGAADRIKFALGRGVIEDAERHLAETRAMIEGLEAKLRAVATAAGAAGAAALGADGTRAA